MEIDSKFIGEHPRLSVISIKVLSNFIEITHRHVYFANLLHIYRTSLTKNTSAWLLLTHEAFDLSRQLHVQTLLLTLNMFHTFVLVFLLITLSK